MSVGETEEEKLYIAFNHKADFDALKERLGEFLTRARAVQLLADNNLTECERGHSHTCVLSAMSGPGFGDVMMVVSVRSFKCDARADVLSYSAEA